MRYQTQLCQLKVGCVLKPCHDWPWCSNRRPLVQDAHSLPTRVRARQSRRKRNLPAMMLTVVLETAREWWSVVWIAVDFRRQEQWHMVRSWR